MGYQAALIALSALAVALLIPPFVWHIRTVNIPLITLLCWLLLMDINTFICAIIWGGDDYQTAWNGNIYCDVVVKLTVGANVGISSSVAGVLFNLYRVLKSDSPLPGLYSFKKLATDLAISLGTPIIIMALNYLVQVRRYTLLQYSGCLNGVDLDWVTIVIYTMWLVIWALVAGIIAVMIVIKYFQKRKDVKDILRCTNSGLNIVRFARLLLFCCVVVLVMLPVSLFLFADGISSTPVNDKYDFAFIHSPSLWNMIQVLSIGSPYITTWVYLAISYLTFIFFGLGSDAIDMYVRALQKIGLGPLIEKFQSRSSKGRLTKADRLVATVLGTTTLNSPGAASGTQFDIEMQRIMEDEESGDVDSKSPTSTQVSDVFGDKHHTYKLQPDLENLADLDIDDMDDEEVRNYINQLYEEENGASTVGTEVTLSSPATAQDGDAATPSSQERSNNVEHYGYSRRITHYVPQ